MRIFIIFICILLSSGNFYCQLIRPNVIYENVIKGVYDHYNNTCIILLHTTQDPIEGQGIRESGNLQNLQGFFSRAYIPIAIMSISTFVEHIGDIRYYDLLRAMFVLLNDDDDVRQQFTLNIAPWIDAYNTWLIFLREETSIKWFFEDIYVSIDSTMMVTQSDGNLSSPGEIITEVYRINEGDKLRSNLLGTWNQEMGIKLSQLSLYQRRNDFQGHTFRVTSVHIPPLSTIIRDHNGAMIGLGGFSGGLLDLLQESMNFTILYQEARHILQVHENGSASGALMDVMFHETDIVAAAVEMYSEVTIFSYTTPIYPAKYRIYIKRPPPPTSNWNAYFISFEPNVWIAIVVMIVITTITMFLVNSAISLFASHWKDNRDIPTSVPDIFFAVFGVFCSQGMVASILDPIRIIHFVIHITGVIILTAYSADMISALTVPPFVMPFTTLEGLLQDGTYRFGVDANSRLWGAFQEAENKIDRAIFNKFLLKENNLAMNALTGLHRVCNEDKYAYMALESVGLLSQSYVGCTLVPLDEIKPVPAAFALGQWSPYKRIINSQLLELKESGIIQKLSNSHLAKTGDNVAEGLKPVGMKNILPLLVLLIAGVFMSLMILSIEKFLKRNEKIIKKEKKIVKKFLKNIRLPSTQKNHVQPFYN